MAVNGLLLRSHIARQMKAGWRGAIAVSSLLYLAVRVGLFAILKAARRSGAASSGLAIGAIAFATTIRARPLRASAVAFAGVVIASALWPHSSTLSEPDEDGDAQVRV